MMMVFFPESADVLRRRAARARRLAAVAPDSAVGGRLCALASQYERQAEVEGGRSCARGRSTQVEGAETALN